MQPNRDSANRLSIADGPSSSGWIPALVAAALAQGPTLFANDTIDGKTLYTEKSCQTCHGAEGKAPLVPSYPRLAGQNAAYLEAQIRDIRAGTRNNGLTAMMKPFVIPLKDEEIGAIAKYLESLK